MKRRLVLPAVLLCSAMIHAQLGLSRMPWEGGLDYWKQFPKADAAEWDDPAFF